MKLPHIVTSLWLVLALSPAFAQTRAEYLAYMKEHDVSLYGAIVGLGTDIDHAANAFGYEGFGGFVDASRESVFVFADCVSFYVSLQGTASNLGLSDGEVLRYAKLRHANDLSFLPACGESYELRWLTVEFLIWTVGEDYPVAFLLRTTTFLPGLPEGTSNEPFETAVLGYASAAQVSHEVEEFIQDAIRDLALLVALNR